jgi:NADH-quinone oxidoreductase subunit N
MLDFDPQPLDGKTDACSISFLATVVPMFPTSAQLDALTWSLGSSLLQFVPELVLCVGIITLLLLRLLPGGERHTGAITAAAFVAIALLLAAYQVSEEAYASSTFQGMLLVDPLAGIMRLVLLGGSLLVILLTHWSHPSDEWDAADLQVLLLGSTLGLMLMVQAHHLLMLFIAVEMAGVPAYALAGFPKQRRRGSEAALKFAIFGAAASGLMLYGMTLLCGVFGTGYLPNILDGITRRGIDLPVGAGAALLFIGLGFKLSVVPLHFWCPDVFEGATAEVAAYLATVSKAATATVLLRLLHSLQQLQPDASSLPMLLGVPLGVIAALTMTVGNLAAFGQSHLQRLLAYSTIAHAGYILLGIAVMTPAAFQAVLFYVMAYVLMNLGAFATVAWVRQATGREDLEGLRGLILRHPAVAVALTIFAASLLGLPPLVGFAAKFQLFLAVYEAGRTASVAASHLSTTWYVLLAIALINTVCSAYYYLRLIRRMILDAIPSTTEAIRPQATSSAGVVYLLLLSAAVVLFGISWSPLIQLCRLAAQMFV